MSASKRGLRIAAAGVLAAALAAASPAWGQTAPAPSPEAGRPGDVRDEMRRYFRTRLKVELGLTDAQAAAIAPRLDEIERSRIETRRERQRLHGELDRRVRSGAPDAQTDDILRRLDDLQVQHESRVRGLMREVNDELTPRQRADLRLFLDRFRGEMRERVDAYRVGRPPRRP